MNLAEEHPTNPLSSSLM